uniref:Uncharacterized protein n=1 Tax=Oryza sativa subsp. japonica TaxID=39947 RepID=Q5Z4X7_ORYSJ|nr:hypothetical protein [Oryza sativa Japonica Group]
MPRNRYLRTPVKSPVPGMKLEWPARKKPSSALKSKKVWREKPKTPAPSPLEEGSSSCRVQVIAGHWGEPIVKVLQDQPVVHPIMRQAATYSCSRTHVYGMDSSLVCWKLEIRPRRALVLPIRKNFERNVVEYLSQVLIAARLA